MTRRTMARRAPLGCVLCVLLGTVLGCGDVSSVLARLTPGPSPAPTSSPPVSTAVPSLPVPTPPSSASPTSLVLWVGDEFAPQIERLAVALTGVQSTALVPQVTLRRKGMEGPGGLVNLMATSAPVAPSVLPDVAIVDVWQARALAQLGLVYAWPESLDVDETDSFPLATPLGYEDTQRIGIPVALDVQHLVYSTTDVRRRPASWRDILTGRAHYLFPAAGKRDALDAFLIQYAMAGGEVDLVAGETATPLQASPLAAALARYQGMRLARVAAPEALQVATLAGCWPFYISNEVSIAQVWSSEYLARRLQLQHTDFAPLPSPNGRGLTVGRRWVMVLVAKEPSRRESAAQLLAWWRAPENNAPLCEATGWLPPSHASFALWERSEPYYAFLRSQLEVARPQFTTDPVLAEGISKAIVQVLEGEATAQESAAQLMSLVSR